MPHAPTACDQCGQFDNHPKWHVGVDTYHHDCAPARVLAEQPENSPVHQVVEAARSGTRGNDLRKHIANLHNEKG